MNKRARLTRRILREHRQGGMWHHEKTVHHGGAMTTWRVWKCPHCPGYSANWRRAVGGRAYR